MVGGSSLARRNEREFKCKPREGEKRGGDESERGIRINSRFSHSALPRPTLLSHWALLELRLQIQFSKLIILQ